MLGGKPLTKPKAVEKEPVALAERTTLAAKVHRVWTQRLGSGTKKQAPTGPEDFVVSVEVNPSPGLSTAKPCATAKMLRQAGVDVINIADGPRATVRMSNSALGEVLMREGGHEVILHMCCRDRNLLGLM